MARTKIRRKDLRQPDEFIELTGRAWQWLQDNRKPTIIVGAVVIVLLVAIAGIRQYQSYRASTAAEAFRKATALLAEGDPKGAAAAFAKLPPVRAYAALGQLYRGHAALKDGDPAGAAEAFRKAASHSDLPSYLRQEALYSLALVLDQQGDTVGALTHYEEAAELPGPFTTDARLSAARVNQAAGDLTKARALYELAVGDAEEGGLAQEDMRKIAAWNLTSLGTEGPAPAPPAE